VKKETDPLTAILFLLLWLPTSMVLNALILRDLWGWFVVPLGVPTLGIAHAAGISTFVRFVTYSLSAKQDTREDKSIWFIVTASALIMALTWGLGWVLHSFMA